MMNKRVTKGYDAQGFSARSFSSALLAMWSIVFLISTVFFAIKLSGTLGDFVLDGMELSIRRVIPSAFPFMIVADLYTAYGCPERIRPLGALISRVLGIPPVGLRAFLCGNLSGFPIGVKISSDLYSSGALEKSSAERLMALSNNPSIPFVIYAVGVGLYGDIRIGFLLLSVLYLSIIITGVITRGSSLSLCRTDDYIPYRFSFISSVKNAGLACVNITSFIMVFSVIIGFLSGVIKNELATGLLSGFFEVTNSVSLLASLTDIPLALRLAVCSFALGFGGLSVAMQSATFTIGTNLSLRHYLAMKLLQGAVCFLLSFLVMQIFKL